MVLFLSVSLTVFPSACQFAAPGASVLPPAGCYATAAACTVTSRFYIYIYIYHQKRFDWSFVQKYILQTVYIPIYSLLYFSCIDVTQLSSVNQFFESRTTHFGIFVFQRVPKSGNVLIHLLQLLLRERFFPPE